MIPGVFDALRIVLTLKPCSFNPCSIVSISGESSLQKLISGFSLVSLSAVALGIFIIKNKD